MKWVYKVKCNPKGEVIRHKAGLVEKGIIKKEGIDFDEVFAHIPKIKTIRLVVGLANMNNWHMCRMVVKCAFLNGPLDKEVYVSQLVRFVKHDGEIKVYKLHKALYGLKQAPRAWNEKIESFLRE